MAPISLTGATLVQQRIPDLLRGERRTMSDSTHNLHFTSTLGDWSRFERDARRHFLQVPWNDIVLDYAPDQRDDTPYHVKHEQLLCGNEHSVVGRFNQNMGHVMTSVTRTCGQADVRFGDFKTAVPDIAVVARRATLLLVGEAKTPWVHDIEEQRNGSVGSSRNYLGQIARYMYLTQRKCGFLTTYDQTIFLKQEEHPRGRGRWVLWHSPVVKNRTQSRPVPDRGGRDREDASNLVLYRGKVSLRECFLYLIALASEERSAQNTMDQNNWSVSIGRFREDDYISDHSTTSSSEEESSQVSHSTRRAEARATQTTGHARARDARLMDDLENRAGRLTLTDQRRSHRDLPQRSREVVVYFSQSQRQWYFENRGRSREYVDLFEEEDEDGRFTLYFIRDGYRCLARRG